MNYRETVTALEARGIMPERPPSLDPMRAGLKRLGFQDWGFGPGKVVVVAGTNGKGSVCAMLEALLLSAGERVGLYISPHLVETTERIRISGKDISEELFCLAYEKVDGPTRDLKLTHFEMLTLMAVWVFCSGEAFAPVDRVILEVGLGGVWDATNAVPHGVAVITSLGMDHENILGRTIQEIAANKFGIVGPGMKVIHASLPPEVTVLAEQVRASTGSEWVRALHYPMEVHIASEEPRFHLLTPWGGAALSLPGARGAENAALALAVFQELGMDPTDHLGALSRVRWPGRMEWLKLPAAPCPVYASGDHNPQGIASLLELLTHYRRAHLHLLVGVGKDKDLEGVLGPLFSLKDCSIYLTETPFRGRKLEEYGDWVGRARGAWADPWFALQRTLEEARKGDLVVVTGSLYLVGAIQAVIQGLQK